MTSDPLAGHRQFSGAPDPAAHGRTPGETRWASSFRISHRLAATMAVGVFIWPGMRPILTPPRGRGMNPGIEDAVFLPNWPGPTAQACPNTNAEQAGWRIAGWCAGGGACLPLGWRASVVAVAVLEDLDPSCGPQGFLGSNPACTSHAPAPASSPVAGFLRSPRVTHYQGKVTLGGFLLVLLLWGWAHAAPELPREPRASAPRAGEQQESGTPQVELPNTTGPIITDTALTQQGRRPGRSKSPPP